MLLLIFFLLHLDFGTGVTVDNRLAEDPEITCGDGFIAIDFRTANQFEGNVFVKDRYADPQCRVKGSGKAKEGRLQLPFMSCGVSRRRSADPRGVFVTATVIISFHEQFITKVDRAFMLQCYYMEAEKVVLTELEVSMLTTSFQTANVPMPICRYEVLSGGPSGAPIRFARIGDKVYHKWTCDTDTIDVFCMIVHTCRVSDGFGDDIELIKPDGCANDIHLLGNLEYPSDLMAGKETHVFKYADRPRLFFDCQISVAVKDPGVACARPICAGDPAPSRGRRAANKTEIYKRPRIVEKLENKIPLYEEEEGSMTLSEICMGTITFSAYTALNSLLMLGSLSLFGASLRQRLAN